MGGERSAIHHELIRSAPSLVYYQGFFCGYVGSVKPIYCFDVFQVHKVDSMVVYKNYKDDDTVF